MSGERVGRLFDPVTETLKKKRKKKYVSYPLFYTKHKGFMIV